MEFREKKSDLRYVHSAIWRQKLEFWPFLELWVYFSLFWPYISQFRLLKYEKKGWIMRYNTDSITNFLFLWKYMTLFDMFIQIETNSVRNRISTIVFNLSLHVIYCFRVWLMCVWSAICRQQWSVYYGQSVWTHQQRNCGSGPRDTQLSCAGGGGLQQWPGQHAQLCQGGFVCEK